MHAIIFDQPGSADVLQLGDVPMPTFGDDDLLIRVRATALNRADILQRRGMYPPPAGASPILGLEIAGEIAACGANVTDWHVGDRVCALLAGGGYAEYVAIPAAMAMQIPDNLTFEQAAAIPEAWITAYDNLFNWGKLAAGESVLIHGGSSGIGTAAIQLARWCGATPFVTVGSDEKAHACKQLGANAINYRSHKWVTELERLSNGAKPAQETSPVPKKPSQGNGMTRAQACCSTTHGITMPAWRALSVLMRLFPTPRTAR